MKQPTKEDYIHGGTQKDYYSENDREECNCLVCNSNNYTKIGEEAGLGIVKCNDCSMIYANPRAKASQENYFGDSSVFFEEARLIFKGKKRHHRDKNYEYEVQQLKRFKKSGNLLDIGTNMGFFLRKAKDAGYDVEGVEPSPSLAKIAHEQWGIKIHNSFLENTDLPTESFDIITLIDVFEHVTNPKELLQKCNSLLKKDGVIAIKIPNGDYNHFKSKLAKKLGASNNMQIWDVCEHVGHYTPKTFNKIVSEKGFRVIKKIIPLPIHSPIWANLVGCRKSPKNKNRSSGPTLLFRR